MELKSALQVFNQSAVPVSPGVVDGLTIRKLAGDREHPSERISVGLATFAPGTHEHLHWHLIETFTISSPAAASCGTSKATATTWVRGTCVRPAGMRGAHEWEVKETLQLLTIKATNAPERAIQSISTGPRWSPAQNSVISSSAARPTSSNRLRNLSTSGQVVPPPIRHSRQAAAGEQRVLQYRFTCTLRHLTTPNIWSAIGPLLNCRPARRR